LRYQKAFGFEYDTSDEEDEVDIFVKFLRMEADLPATPPPTPPPVFTPEMSSDSDEEGYHSAA
jgi:hypothetical protein